MTTQEKTIQFLEMDIKQLKRENTEQQKEIVRLRVELAQIGNLASYSKDMNAVMMKASRALDVQPTKTN